MDESHQRQTRWRFHLRLLAPSLLMVALVAVVAVNAINVLGAVRAYVAGESQWSKARSDAVQHLLHYAQSHDSEDLKAFETALQVPLGDRRAREGMGRQPMDVEQVRQDLLVGGNHPDDVDHMIALFHRFGDQWIFKEALAAWVLGDDLIDQLRAQSRQLQQLVHEGAQPDRIEARTRAILQLNAALKANELHFSASLGRASRITEQVLIGSVVLAALILATLSLTWTRRTLAQQMDRQALLITNNRRWELATTSAGVGVYELDVLQQQVHLDAKAADLHGLGTTAVVMSREALNGMILPEDLPSARASVDQAVQSGQVFKMSYRIRRPDQLVRWLEATGRLLPDPATESVRVVGVVRDITDERQQAEAAMKRDAAERVARAQREFLSRLSHELRTPLNAILGFAQLMLLDTTRPLPQAQTRQVQLIHSAGRQLLALIEDVLDLSKVESGDIPMSLQSVDVCQSLRTCLPLIDAARERLAVRVVDQLPDTPVLAIADPQRLQQIFMNLLTNACKYNRPQGRIILDCRRSGDQILIDITDTGVGLNADEAAQLFQPFKRIAPQADVEGTGLGLYIVRQLVERMGGQVSLHSRSGEGSCFTVALPADLNG